MMQQEQGSRSRSITATRTSKRRTSCNAMTIICNVQILLLLCTKLDILLIQARDKKKQIIKNKLEHNNWINAKLKEIDG